MQEKGVKNARMVAGTPKRRGTMLTPTWQGWKLAHITGGSAPSSSLSFTLEIRTLLRAHFLYWLARPSFLLDQVSISLSIKNINNSK